MIVQLASALDLVTAARVAYVRAMVDGTSEAWRHAGELLDEAIAQLQRGMDAQQQSAQRSQEGLNEWYPRAQRLQDLRHVLQQEANAAWNRFLLELRAIAGRSA
jgi:1,2-phenylacetyl-CoA epoxidase catalytic subunit